MSPFTLKRKAARIVLLNEAGEVLLLRAHDPADHRKPPWWEIPGGGIDRGESTAEAAARELYEETGVRDAEIGPCIWVQHSEFDFGGFHFDQDEWIHVAWYRGDAAGAEYNPAHLEAIEAMAFEGSQWWSLDDLLASDEPLLPVRLRELLPPIVAGDLPDEPIDITVASSS